MRKLFSILCASLVALAMQATVITKNYDLSGASAYGTATVSGGSITGAAEWNGLQAWAWTEGISAYDQIVIALEDHAQTVLFKVIYTDEYSMQVELPTGTNTEVINLDPVQNIVKGIQVLNWSSESGIDITITDLFFRGAIGNKKNVTLWSGSKAFDNFDWANRLLINAEDFADLHVGDILEVYYSTNAESYHQFDIKTNYDNNYPSFAPVQINLGGSNEDGVSRFYIADATDLSNIASQGGLYLNGKYITFTKVSVIKHEVLWTGTTDAGNWSGYQEISSSKLSDLKVGNIICVRITDLTIDGESQVALWYNNGSWTEFSPSVNYYFQDGDEAPMDVEFPVTYKMEKQLRGKNLLVRGKNYTMTDIYVKEGTPVNTIAEYLTVTDAGMATYMLPFNVPALPDGVQAYTLTNDGSNVITATPAYSLAADKPVLIIAEPGEYEFISESDASGDISGKAGTFTNGNLIGTYSTIANIPTSTASVNNYVLQKKAGVVGFYRVESDGCSITPYHAYLSCGYNTNPGTPAGAPMRIVLRTDAATQLDVLHDGDKQVGKYFRDGQIIIIRDGKIYNMLGALIN
ncbi:MAG: hypothetical protein IJS13_07560 [Paludibacteraceae bacterium]|nr:hypothetical protein [Paludibacteraceae bacterium]